MRFRKYSFLLSVAISTALLSGCLPTTFALLKNNSNQDVIASNKDVKIEAGEKKRIGWNTACMKLDIDGEERHFETSVYTPPDVELFQLSWTKITYRVVYQDQKFYYSSKKNGLIPMKEVDFCE